MRRPGPVRGGSFMMSGGSFMMSGAEAALGLVTLAWPLAWALAWAYAVAGAAAAGVLAGAFARWRQGPVLAVAAATLTCAFSRAGTVVLAAEGLFILGYLLAADAPAGLTRPGRWVRHQILPTAAGLIAAGAVLAALALRPAPSAWLTAAGLAAAAGGYLVALPWGRARGQARHERLVQPAPPGTGTPIGLG